MSQNSLLSCKMGGWPRLHGGYCRTKQLLIQFVSPFQNLPGDTNDKSPVSLFQHLLRSTLPLKMWKMTCPQTILYSHCFPASHRPEAWFPQRPKPTADSFTPTEDAAAHLCVPLANPAASNQVLTFTVSVLATYIPSF